MLSYKLGHALVALIAVVVHAAIARLAAVAKHDAHWRLWEGHTSA